MTNSTGKGKIAEKIGLCLLLALTTLAAGAVKRVACVGASITEGAFTVIHKPGFKHHPHSLPNPDPIVRFALESTAEQNKSR